MAFAAGAVPQFDEALATEGVDVLTLVFVSAAPDERLVDLLNEVARAKAKLVQAGELSAECFASEVNEVSRRHQASLSADGCRYVGELLDHAGRPDLAVRYYEATIEAKPDDAETWNKLGVVLAKMGHTAQAEQALQKALALKPGYHRALNNPGIVLSDLKRHDMALATLNKAIGSKPDYGLALLNRGDLLFDMGRPEQAVESFLEAARHEEQFRQSDLALLYSGLGIAIAAAGRPQDATEHLERARHLGADSGQSWFNLAMVYGLLHRFKDARSALRAFHDSPGANKFLKDAASRNAVEVLDKDIARWECDRQVRLRTITDWMASNPIPVGMSRFTREELHERDGHQYPCLCP